MSNTITITAKDGTLVLTGDSSIIHGGIVATEYEDHVVVSVGWGVSATRDGAAAVWDYIVGLNEWSAVLADGIRSGSLGTFANLVKATAEAAHKMTERTAELWPAFVRRSALAA